MDRAILGRTGLEVSVAGLGCGGSSRLGLGLGKSEEHAAMIVRTAFDAGVNFFDTANIYGTETAVGLALADLPRDEVVVATKSQVAKAGRLLEANEVFANLDNSLRCLGIEHIDLFMLHAVRPEQYDHALTLLDALANAKAAGKIGHIGITETSPFDPDHRMLSRAVDDPRWQIVMLAFHMMHQNARQNVFPKTRTNRIGTLGMFAVRAIFSQPQRLRQAMVDLVDQGQLPGSFADEDDPLGFLVHEFGAKSLIDAAYRFVRHEPGMDVVLFGTGTPAHIESNVASINAPPLPQEATHRLAQLFGHLSGVGLDLPAPRQA